MLVEYTNDMSARGSKVYQRGSEVAGQGNRGLLTKSKNLQFRRQYRIGPQIR
jgi:hypothetical protein